MDLVGGGRALGAANALGYLAGALITMRFVQSWGNRRLFAIGLALTAVALLAAGTTRDHTMQALWRALAGLGAAGARSSAAACLRARSR